MRDENIARACLVLAFALAGSILVIHGAWTASVPEMLLGWYTTWIGQCGKGGE